MTWNKFDSLDSSTWPPVDLEVLWKIKVNQFEGEGINIVSHLRIDYEDRPVIWDALLEGPGSARFGSDRYLDKHTETSYWMLIPPVSAEMSVKETFPVHPDDTFNF